MNYNRYVLNYKKIPYNTEWVEYPDISAHCQKVGLPKTSTRLTKRSGVKYHTLPAIHDPSTGITLSDSALIAEYLENQYPDGPNVFPHNTIGLQIDFHDSMSAVLAALWDFVIPPIIAVLNPTSREYYRETREQTWGKRLEDIPPSGDKYTEEWAKVERGFTQMATWYEKVADGPFIMGKEASWADFVVGAHLMWFSKAWGDDDKKWKAIMSWNGGVWKALFNALEQYGAAD